MISQNRFGVKEIDADRRYKMEAMVMPDTNHWISCLYQWNIATYYKWYTIRRN